MSSFEGVTPSFLFSPVPQFICRRCYRGNLISVHNIYFNRRLQCSVSRLNQGQVWIGGRVVGWVRGVPALNGEHS